MSVPLSFRRVTRCLECAYGTNMVFFLSVCFVHSQHEIWTTTQHPISGNRWSSLYSKGKDKLKSGKLGKSLIWICFHKEKRWKYWLKKTQTLTGTQIRQVKPESVHKYPKWDITTTGQIFWKKLECGANVLCGANVSLNHNLWRKRASPI